MSKPKIDPAALRAMAEQIDNDNPEEFDPEIDDYNDDDADIEMGRTEAKLSRLVVLVERHPHYACHEIKSDGEDDDLTEWLLTAADAERAWRSLDPGYMVSHNADGSHSASGFPYFPNFMRAAIKFAEQDFSFSIELRTAFSAEAARSAFPISCCWPMPASSSSAQTASIASPPRSRHRPRDQGRLLKYWFTEDSDYILHPEACVAPLPRTPALARLEEMVAAEKRVHEEAECGFGGPKRRDP